MNTSNIMESQYNLTKIISGDIIDNPTSWFSNFNSELGGYLFITLVAVLGLVLFFVMRERSNVKDSEAALFSGFIISLVSLLAFLVTAVEGVKIISFEQFVTVLVFTGVMVIAHFIRQRY